jgi:cell division protein FtsB
MKHASKENKKKFPLLVFVFTAVFISFSLSFFMGQNGILRLQQLRREYDSLMMQNHRLALENRKLGEEIERLKRDPVTVEKIAREELHFVSPHDVVLLVPREDPQ